MLPLRSKVIRSLGGFCLSEGLGGSFRFRLPPETSEGGCEVSMKDFWVTGVAPLDRSESKSCLRTKVWFWKFSRQSSSSEEEKQMGCYLRRLLVLLERFRSFCFKPKGDT